MADWNIGVKNVFFCVLLALCWMQPASSYSIECLTVDMDCGDVPTTMASVCRVYKPFVPLNHPYPSKKRRSVSNSTEHNLVESSSSSFHPRATHLTKAKADQDSRTALEMASKIREISLSREEANTMLHTNRRLRRQVGRKTLREECCGNTPFRPCTYEEVAEYCEVLHDEALTCPRP
uniref:Insulin-like androgenic gland factor n=1 Tax=Palaemon pacificus TaxID=586763 RepID=F1SZD0_9EUCA|nr:insulin-like androgenic gland factor [Palaemon pacificus]